ncbi:energy-coupling factor ABC transporter ATP-binding protein [Marichromatium bheemlicum]|uniref:ABC transporter ATP-binding protein n=1 Tax=Marichromatium bheemlicum TaxID=365339 RepID=A0ABX1I2Q6_9GAMM|nr:ABC transporter ATP-binding protein [Marichromatium bheemlicum]NKN31659.1 ABC transporter ATP-binding protein [Marichromatium bheemlicum]
MDPLFRLTDIHFAYPGRPPVLAGVGLTIRPGERIAVHGANGSGKSTLLQLMVGLLRPTAGTLVAFGAPRCVERDFHVVRRRTGLVFQDADDQLFCPTVTEDIAFGPRNLGQSPAQARATVEHTLARLGLEHLRDRVTHRLSGGERRLVALAAVLAMAPEVLLLDEPTNALDAPTRARLLQILTDLDQTLVLVSHDSPLRQALATRHYRLDQGRLEAG